ncbi:MAG: DUF2634 domain-containing protein [Clostridia bacterium]|nr:DUF2634 domain-containing protein [Clostridia bacterium]
MVESVYIKLAVDTVEEATEQPSKTYKLDLDKGRIIGLVDGQEAVRQAIRKAIITPRFKCLIYDKQYGSEIEEAVTQKDATPEYTEAIAPGFVRDALRPDTRITGVSNFTFSFKDDEAYISFDADTIFGTVRIEEVI